MAWLVDIWILNFRLLITVDELPESIGMRHLFFGWHFPMYSKSNTRSMSAEIFLYFTYRKQTNNNETEMKRIWFFSHLLVVCFKWNMKLRMEFCRLQQIVSNYPKVLWFLWCPFGTIHNTTGNWRVLQKIEHIMSVERCRGIAVTWIANKLR